MEQVWFSAALWLPLALIATLFSIWFKIAAALSEIAVSAQLTIDAEPGTGSPDAKVAGIGFWAGMDPQLPLIGMAKERQRLSAALRNRGQLLVLGPQGCGKTRVLKELLHDNEGVQYLPWQSSLHGLLVALARTLIEIGHAEFLHRARLPRGRNANIEKWLADQTSIHLKGLLWNSFERAPVPMVLDGIAGCGFATYRFLQQIYRGRGIGLVAAARNPLSLGAAARLFWDPAKTLNIQPLHEEDAARLFDTAIYHFRLRDLDMDDFRKRVLDSARGNPGQIIEMCRLATQPKYISGRYVKFAPLRIDTLIKFGG